jgi:hypothetical protein
LFCPNQVLFEKKNLLFRKGLELIFLNCEELSFFAEELSCDGRSNGLEEILSSLFPLMFDLFFLNNFLFCFEAFLSLI